MGYSIIFGDITQVKTDVIVNSLGIDGNVYGMVCEAILDAAKSPELTNYVDSLQNNNIGDIFITDSGELLCQKIFHIVTPFKFLDDKNNSLLEKAYVDILGKAIELGYKSIALPLIGCGANGYSEHEVSKVVTKVCGNLALKEYEEKHDILDVVLVSYVKPKRRHRERVEEEYYNARFFETPRVLTECNAVSISSDDSFEINKAPKTKTSSVKYKGISQNQIIKNILLIQKAYTYLKPEELLAVEIGNRPYAFVINHLNDIGMDDKEFILQGVPSDVKTRWSSRKEIEKINIYRIAFITKMNFSRLLQFMMINNKQFSPEDELDIFMIKYFEGKSFYKCYTLTEFSLLCFKECNVSLEYERTKKNYY